MEKKLKLIPNNKIKSLFKKTKNEILLEGYSSKINKKLTKIIGFENYRKSEKGKNKIKEIKSSKEYKLKRKEYAKSDAGKKSRLKYSQSKKGKENNKRRYLKAKAKPDYREKMNKYVRDRKKKDPIFKMSMD